MLHQFDYPLSHVFPVLGNIWYPKVVHVYDWLRLPSLPSNLKTSNLRFPAFLSCPVCYKQTCLLRPGTWHHCKQAESLAVHLRHICVESELPKPLPVPDVMNMALRPLPQRAERASSV